MCRVIFTCILNPSSDFCPLRMTCGGVYAIGMFAPLTLFSLSPWRSVAHCGSFPFNTLRLRASRCSLQPRLTYSTSHCGIAIHIGVHPRTLRGNDGDSEQPRCPGESTRPSTLKSSWAVPPPPPPVSESVLRTPRTYVNLPRGDKMYLAILF